MQRYYLTSIRSHPTCLSIRFVKTPKNLNRKIKRIFIMPCFFESERITCTRGSKAKKPTNKVTDRQGNTWLTEVTKENFRVREIIDVTSEDGSVKKRFK